METHQAAPMVDEEFRNTVRLSSVYRKTKIFLIHCVYPFAGQRLASSMTIPNSQMALVKILLLTNCYV